MTAKDAMERIHILNASITQYNRAINTLEDEGNMSTPMSHLKIKRGELEFERDQLTKRLSRVGLPEL